MAGPALRSLLASLRQSVEAVVRLHASRLMFRLVVGLSLLVAVLFAGAGLLVHVGTVYGPVAACGAGAVAFLLIAAILAIAAKVSARRLDSDARKRAAETERAARSMSMASLMPAVQSVLEGKALRAVPLALIGGLVLGYVMSRPRRPADS